jgi:glycosyltransferase involved in cell wall biosynthesis
MARPLCSVVLATYQRRHLLERSLVCYERQEFDNDRFELIVIDDHSNDGVREAILDWSKKTKIRATVLTVFPKPAEWVDCGWVLNAGIRASAGEHVILTHPEVMVGRRSVAACVEWLREEETRRPNNDDDQCGWKSVGGYAACRVYYMSPACQEKIDTVPWWDDPLKVREIPGFYDPVPGGNPHYHPSFMDKVGTPGCSVQTWDSWVFGGCSRETWKRLGGMMVSKRWGSVDILFNHRRKKLGMAEWTAPVEDTVVVHQNHDIPGNVPTDRDMQAWKDECAGIPHGDNELAFPAVDNLGW